MGVSWSYKTILIDYGVHIYYLLINEDVFLLCSPGNMSVTEKCFLPDSDNANYESGFIPNSHTEQKHTVYPKDIYLYLRIDTMPIQNACPS